MSERHFIDVPNPYDLQGPWINIDSFDTREEALAAARELFGADEEGKISLVSSFTEEDDEEEDQP